MDLSKITIGKNPPDELNVIIEISGGDTGPVKYEFDKDSGCIKVDRIMKTSMRYPCGYGFVPHTLSNDGDPLDVLVVSMANFCVGSCVSVRPIGVLIMEDEAGMDEKIIAVPAGKIDPVYSKVHDLSEIAGVILESIKHFFEHYKDLDEGKWVKVRDWKNRDDAIALIKSAINRMPA